MRRRNSELLWALLAIAIISVAYLLGVWRLGEVLRSSSLWGHTIGAVGFTMMLMTEVLYSVRKRSKRVARLGSMRSWLQFHIFTGTVGPYLVLLHTGGRFSGMAGLATALTVVVVLSGFIGRYIYTALPRSALGVELDGSDLQSLIDSAEIQLKQLLESNATLMTAAPQDITSLPRLGYNAWPIIFGRGFLEMGYQWRWRRMQRELKGTDPGQVRELGLCLSRRRELHYQVANLVSARQALALWHSVHVPIGVALFTAASIHTGAALYYVTLAP